MSLSGLPAGKQMEAAWEPKNKIQGRMLTVISGTRNRTTIKWEAKSITAKDSSHQESSRTSIELLLLSSGSRNSKTLTYLHTSSLPPSLSLFFLSSTWGAVTQSGWLTVRLPTKFNLASGVLNLRDEPMRQRNWRKTGKQLGKEGMCVSKGGMLSRMRREMIWASTLN